MRKLTGGGRSVVHLDGDVVYRRPTPATPAVHALLRHLAAAGFAGAPRLVGTGFAADGRETLTYVPGGFTHPGPWSLDGVTAVGALLRDLHDATADFRPPPDARWYDWHARGLGDGPRVISHCDAAPWNVVARDGLPVALIDWEFAGPADELVAVAQAAWLHVKLHDDLVAAREGLPPLAERARQLRAFAEGYRLAAAGRHRLVETMIEFVVSEVAWEADDAGVTSPEVTAHPVALWGMAWRARAANFLVRHRRVLANALA